MEHPPERVLSRQLRDQPRHRITIGHITGHHRNLRPGLFEPAHHLRDTLRLGAAATDQHHMGHPIPGHQMSGHRRTGHPGTPGDHHAAPGQATTRTRQHHVAGPVGDGEHDLADLAGLADKPIRRRGTPHIKRLDRQRL